MPIWYVFERATGRFAGSGTMEIRNDTHDCTEAPLTPAPLSEPEAVYDADTGAWGWRADWATAGDLPMLGDTREKDGRTWESLRDNNFWPVGVLAGWKPVLAAVVQWSPSGVYTQGQIVTDAEGVRRWALQTASETAAVGREPWQAYMWAVWQEVT